MIQNVFLHSYPPVFPGRYSYPLPGRVGGPESLGALKTHRQLALEKSSAAQSDTEMSGSNREHLPNFSLKKPAEGKPIPSGADIRVSKVDWEVFAVLYSTSVSLFAFMKDEIYIFFYKVDIPEI